jgi:hypothetical protein
MTTGLIFLIVAAVVAYFSWQSQPFYRASNNVMILVIVAILGLFGMIALMGMKRSIVPLASAQQSLFPEAPMAPTEDHPFAR